MHYLIHLSHNSVTQTLLFQFQWRRNRLQRSGDLCKARWQGWDPSPTADSQVQCTLSLPHSCWAPKTVSLVGLITLAIRSQDFTLSPGWAVWFVYGFWAKACCLRYKWGPSNSVQSRENVLNHGTTLLYSLQGRKMSTLCITCIKWGANLSHYSDLLK